MGFLSNPERQGWGVTFLKRFPESSLLRLREMNLDEIRCRGLEISLVSCVKDLSICKGFHEFDPQREVGLSERHRPHESSEAKVSTLGQASGRALSDQKFKSWSWGCCDAFAQAEP